MRRLSASRFGWGPQASRVFSALFALGLVTFSVGCESLTEPNAITIRKEPPRPKAPEPAPEAAAPAAPAGGAAGARGAGAPGGAGAAMPAAPKAGGG